jgi:hypothetical protein
LKETKAQSTDADWLVKAPSTKASLVENKTTQMLVLENALMKRVFFTGPNLACVSFLNKVNHQELIRAIQPEAKITIDGTEYFVGGLKGQKERAYLLPEWLPGFSKGASDFVYMGYTQSALEPFIKANTGKYWMPQQEKAGGVHLELKFASSLASLAGLVVSVHYELYDAMPLVVKWISIENNTTQIHHISKVVNESLALVEEESAVVGKPEEMKKQHGLYVETNYAFNNAMRYDISDQTTHWQTDAAYTSQVNYNYETPCILEVYPEYAPGVDLKPGGKFKSVRTHELLMDSYDRERRGLAIRKMYRAVAPWVTANPVFMHLVSRNDEEVKTAIDQCVQTGYEAVILSFGSHLNMEDSTTQNVERWKKLAAYAHSKNILIGGYSLFSSRRISDADDVVDYKTGKPGGAFFGNAPCFGSVWGLNYRDKIQQFYAKTGFDIWENDGPYPGDRCASTTHPGHKGLEDSQWQQMEIQKGLYRWLNEHGVYINAPDWYFLDGTHKIAIGYREVNFSLSREQQKILNRQNIHDGTLEKIPSMGWGFVPLTRYQGGGPEAILEPLSEHLSDYEQLMVQYYGAGVQACYRGPRLYDTDTTRKMVARVVSWYKKYREILNSDIIHLRRADGRDWDGWMHVNPSLKEKALVMLFNPTAQTLERTLQLPLHYTGLKGGVWVREKEGKPKWYRFNNETLELPVKLLPGSTTWMVLEDESTQKLKK